MGKHEECQRERVLRFLHSFVADNGYPPSYEEIREALGLSSRSHVGYYLQALERDGRIERMARSPRGLRILTMNQAPSGSRKGKDQ
jgi:repressor LexA